MKMSVTQGHINNIAYKVVGSAIEVHKHLGPGMLESIYHLCFLEELASRKLEVRPQVRVPVAYKGKDLGAYLVLDILVEDLIVVELKAVDVLTPLHKAQLLSYLRLTGKPKGLLINLNCENISKNLVPLVTDLFNRFPED